VDAEKNPANFGVLTAILIMASQGTVQTLCLPLCLPLRQGMSGKTVKMKDQVGDKVKDEVGDTP
jgi:hypothetical protein